MEGKTARLAYVCSNCDEYKIFDINIFDFSGNRKRIYSCECERSELSVTKNGAKSFKIDLFCPICKEMHSYMVPFNQFFSDNVFSFSCPYYEANLLFIGSKDKLDMQLSEYIEDDTLREEETHIIYDNETIDKMVTLTKNVYEHPEKFHICECQSTYSVAYNEKGIYIICDKCNFALPVKFDKIDTISEGDIKNV
ncbi:MAG: hypothetical protein E7419_00110 [Ruminococcaceae bacterium]|nr:hypothetical protein [Oscillospiraceae bacterium]